jgi:phage shock protein PspC (stress-responsive transcriptional regulator)
VLGGVCSGLSVATGVDVTLVRLAFIIAGFAGFGVLAYIILLLVLPREDPEHGQPLTPAPPDVARWLRAALVVVPLLSITGWAGFRSSPFGWNWWRHDRGSGVGFGTVLVLIGAGIIWLRRRHDTHEREPVPARVDAGERPSERATPPRAAWWSAPAASPSVSPPTPLSATDTSAVQTASSEPSTGAALVIARISAWLASLGAVVLAGVTITLERLGVLSIAAPALLAVVAAGALAGMVVITVRSRKPWTLVATQTVLLVPVLLGLALGRWIGGVGDRIEAPTAIARVQPQYRLGIGHLRVDLHRLALDGKTVNVAADTRIGVMDVIVPADARITLDAHVGAGQMSVFDYSRDGTSLDQHIDDAPSSTLGTIKLHVNMAIGQLRVCRASTSSRATTCSGVLAGA